jgi:hypothetical protein
VVSGLVTALSQPLFNILARRICACSAESAGKVINERGQRRSGAEAALFYKWGCKNAAGSDGFKQNRPGGD